MKKMLCICLTLLMTLTLCNSFVFAENETTNTEDPTAQNQTDYVLDESTAADESEFTTVGNLNNFQKNSSPIAFTDLEENEWYIDSVNEAVAYGLIKGMSDSTFEPKGNLTIAQCITLASRIRSIYETGSETFVQGDPWYQVYVDYALDKGIIEELADDSSMKITRGEFANMMANTLEEELSDINEVPDGSIPDVSPEDDCYEAMYTLYRAGIMNGNDSAGSAYPAAELSRCEASAMLLRIINPDERKHITLSLLSASSAKVTNVARHNISYSAVTNNGDKSLPSSVTNLEVNDSAYFNVHISSDQKAKSFTLYCKLPGAGVGQYTKLHTENAENYIRYANYRYKFSKEGKYKYYWVIKYTNGSTKELAVQSAWASKSTNNDKSYWDGKVGKKVSSYTGLQCVGYVRNRAKEKGHRAEIYGNANQWWSRASSYSYSSGSTPKSDSIACFNGGRYGHVIYVEYYDKNTSTVYYTENNRTTHKDGVVYKASLSSFKNLNPYGFKGFVYTK